MGYTPGNNIGSLRHDFSGEAANDEELPLCAQLLAHMNGQKDDIVRSFYDEMTGVSREMNMDAALTKQSGMLNGQPLDGETPIVTHTDLAVWMYVDKETWDATIDSYIDDLALNDTEKFLRVYQTVGDASLTHYQQTNQHLDMAATRMAFEEAYKDDMQALALVADMLRKHLSGVVVETHIMHIEDSHITPVVRLKAPEDRDLRHIVRDFIDKKAAISDVSLHLV